MRITTVICTIAVLAALFFIVYTFMVEGFLAAADANARMGQNADTICMAFGNGSTGDCSKCLDPDGTNHSGTQCGYWAQGNACIPRSGIYRLVPDWLTQKQNSDKTYPQIFDPNDFIYDIGKCGGEACSSFKSCRTCAGASACGWCDTNNTCMDRTAVSANLDAISKAGSAGSSGSPPPPMCPALDSTGQPGITSSRMISNDASHAVLVQEIGTCRPETCSDKTNCFDCANTSGCGFCRTTKKCIKVDSAGNDAAAAVSGSNGSGVCATGEISLQAYMCPCSGMSDCKTCATQPGCGWCVAGKNCVNVMAPSKGDSQNMLGGVNTRDCAAGGDGVATSATQCTPGAKLGNVRSERDGSKPTAVASPGKPGVDIAAATRMGSGPVSPATTGANVTGNGVVRPYGAGNRNPYSVTNQPNLFTSPFEEYVKVLIKSELAEQGVPTNEPFQ